MFLKQKVVSFCLPETNKQKVVWVVSSYFLVTKLCLLFFERFLKQAASGSWNKQPFEFLKQAKKNSRRKQQKKTAEQQNSRTAPYLFFEFFKENKQKKTAEQEKKAPFLWAVLETSRRRAAALVFERFFFFLLVLLLLEVFFCSEKKRTIFFERQLAVLETSSPSFWAVLETKEAEEEKNSAISFLLPRKT